MRQPNTILEIVYADICGPMQEPDFWGHRYFALFDCGKSRYKFLCFLFQRSNVLQVFKVFKNWSEKQFSTHLRVLHTDGGGEFNSKDLHAWLALVGIDHVTTPPYSAHMNGACEVWNRVIVHTASAILLTTYLPLSFWPQPTLCATYLLNHSPTKGLCLRCTPYEALHGKLALHWTHSNLSVPRICTYTQGN